MRRPSSVGINIPAGIADGQVITIRGKGNAGTNGGPGGRPGNPGRGPAHPVFEREGYDVYCELPLTFAQMALGAEVQVPTLDGNVPYTVREGTQPGETFRLKGKGFPYINGRGRGDEVVG